MADNNDCRNFYGWIPHPVIVYGSDSNAEYANAAAERLFGSAPDPAFPRSLPELLDALRSGADRGEAVQEIGTSEESRTITCTIHCAGYGAKRRMKVSLSAPSGGFDATVALFIDVTEEDRLIHEDALTGLPNRRAYEQIVTRSLHSMKRGRYESIGMLLIDIDHFKRVNDTYGHDGGDTVLVRIAECLTQSVRADDVVARYGGEEFIAVLPDADREETAVIAERVRRAVESLDIRLIDGASVRVSVSIGFSVMSQGSICDTMSDAECIGLSVLSADQALYSAKRSGRNRTRCAQNVP